MDPVFGFYWGGKGGLAHITMMLFLLLEKEDIWRELQGRGAASTAGLLARQGQACMVEGSLLQGLQSQLCPRQAARPSSISLNLSRLVCLMRIIKPLSNCEDKASWWHQYSA